MPLTFWPHAFVTATYLINRLPAPTLKNLSPFLKQFGESPNYHKLQNFGCLCYPWLRPYKLENHSLPCIFVGYSPSQSAYYCLHLATKRIYVSRHVKFVDDIFPYQDLCSSPSPLSQPNLEEWCTIDIPLPVQSSISIPTQPLLTPPTSPSSPSPPPSSPSPLPQPPPPPSPPHRTIVTRLQNKIVKPNPKFAHHATVQSQVCEPRNISQALKDPQWREAMAAEHAALIRNGT